MGHQVTQGKLCSTCGRPLSHTGAEPSRHPGRPGDQLFSCPEGHEVWRLSGVSLTWEVNPGAEGEGRESEGAPRTGPVHPRARQQPQH
jgi:hypothetical protein